MPNAALQAALLRDAATMLTDFGTTVVNGSTSTTGTLDQRDEAEEQNGFVVQQRRLVLTLVTGTGGAIVDGTVLTVGGRRYRVDGNGIPVPPDAAHTAYRLVGAP